MTPFDAMTVSLDGALVEASAGTGKTYAITTLVLRLVVERGVPLPRILVVTFTRAATAELRDRIRARLRAALAAFDGGDTEDEALRALVRANDAALAQRRLSAALRDFDEASISTIHGFCQRVLATYAFESGARFDTEIVTTVDTLLEDIVTDYWAAHVYAAPELFVAHLEAAKVTRATLLAIAAKATATRGVIVVPSVLEPPALERLLATHQASWSAAAAVFREAGDEVARLLRSSGLGRVAAKQLDARLDEIARYLADPSRRETVPDKLDFFRKDALVAATNKGFSAPAHPFFLAVSALDDAWRAVTASLDARVLAMRTGVVRYAERELVRRNAEAGRQSFDDLLHAVRGALAGPRGDALRTAMRATWSAALVDEFQDTDPAQYEIFRDVFGSGAGALFLVGDPKQAIYSFRGADVFAYLAAARDVASDRRTTLTTSWRSDPLLVRAINTVFTRVPRPFLLDEIGFPPVAPKPSAKERLAASDGRPLGGLRVLFVERDDEKARTKESARPLVTELVASDVARFLASGATLEGRPVTPGDLAVLVRKNKEGAAVQEALRARGVPSVLYGDQSVLDSPEALEVQEVVLALAEPGNARAVRAALTTSLFALSAHDLVALDDDERVFDFWATRFREWHARWRDRGFFQAFRRMIDDAEVTARLLAATDGERRMTNVLHVAELLHEAATTRRLGMTGLGRWLALVRASKRERAEIASDAAQLRLESDASAVKLVTTHQSKGLEYPITWVPFAWDGRLLRGPDRVAVRFHEGDALTLDVGSTEVAAHVKRAEDEAAAENLRLLYVALTRARHRCTLVWGAFREGQTSALAHVLHPSEAGAGEDRVASAQRVAKLDDRAMRADLTALALASDGAIAIETAAVAPSPAFRSPEDRAATYAARVPHARAPFWWRTSSFSRLADGGPLAPVEEEGRDRDAVDADAPDGAKRSSERVALWDLPRGRTTGDVVHGIFEDADFTSRDRDALVQLAERRLARHGMAIDPWRQRLADAVSGVLDTPLVEESDVLLRRVTAEQRVSELEFILPIADHAGARALTPRALGDVFVEHGDADVRAYGERARTLVFPPLEGFLQGFVDLVFEQDGRFFLVDWKTTWLGASPDDYAPPRLARAMAEHHYVLQAHLYAVALHRHLGRTLPAYDYDRHFGGALYLFVRGVAPFTGATRGVHFDRPSRALIEALSNLFSGGAP